MERERSIACGTSFVATKLIAAARLEFAANDGDGIETDGGWTFFRA